MGLVRFGVWVFGAGDITLGALTDDYGVDVPYFLTLLVIFTLIYAGLFYFASAPGAVGEGGGGGGVGGQQSER